MRLSLSILAVVAIAGCAPSVPDSASGVPDIGRGVGFGNYADYQAQRDAQLEGRSATTVPGPIGVQASALDDTSNDIAAQAAAALNSGVAPLEASPSNPAPQAVANSAGISNENNFDAVAAERDIAADAALIAQNRAQFQVIAPTDLPTRPGSDRPNIVAFALQTTNPVGTSLYRRTGSEARAARACAAFPSADLAQEEFLANGGPQRDRKGMDPDGDGFACGWNPAPFRAARNG